MKIKFWILVVIIYKVTGNVSCKFKSYLRSHLRWPKLLIRSKKSQKRLFLTLFYIFFGIFEDFSKVKICKLTMPFSLLIFGVFWEKQGLNLQHLYFLTFLRRFALHFRVIQKNFFELNFFPLCGKCYLKCADSAALILYI